MMYIYIYYVICFNTVDGLWCISLCIQMDYVKYTSREGIDKDE